MKQFDDEDEVTYDRYDVEKANEKSFFGKNMTFKKLFQ